MSSKIKPVIIKPSHKGIGSEAMFNSIKARAFYYNMINSSHRKFSSFNGVTPSERNIINLIKKSNLNYWTISNPYCQKGYEMCDVLVIFDNNVIIISDKEKDISKTSIEKSWVNFYKHLKKSEEQLIYAKNWIINNPNEIYYDDKATERVEVNLDINKIKFHLITTISNWSDTAKNYFKNDGSLLIDTDIKKQSNKKILTLHNRVKEGNFLHMFDDYSFEILLKEMSTTSDFIQYLNEREKFFISNENKNRVIKADGELALLGTYIKNIHSGLKTNLFKEKRIFKDNKFIFNSNTYIEIQNHPNEKLFKEKFNKSLVIDDLINIFSYVGDIKNSGITDVDEPNEADYRTGLEVFAGLSRTERIQLFELINEKFEKAKYKLNTFKSINYIYGHRKNIFILVIGYINSQDEQEMIKYRRERISHLYERIDKCLTNPKLKNYDNIIGLAFDNPYGIWSESEDLICIQNN